MILARIVGTVVATRKDPRLDRFVKACKQVASEGVSHLAERIDDAAPTGDEDLVASQVSRSSTVGAQYSWTPWPYIARRSWGM